MLGVNNETNDIAQDGIYYYGKFQFGANQSYPYESIYMFDTLLDYSWVPTVDSTGSLYQIYNFSESSVAKKVNDTQYTWNVNYDG